MVQVMKSLNPFIITINDTIMKLLVLIGVTALIAVGQAHRDPCVCPRIYLPVCGSDGKTYGNECTFNCEKQTKNHELQLKHMGECEEVEEGEIQEIPFHRDPCTCTKIYQPVCGSDGKTYGNPCTLNCAKETKNHELKMAHFGECEETEALVELFPMSECGCVRLLSAVCGTDGVTYSNPCELNCAKRRYNHKLEIAYDGHCKTDVLTKEAQDYSCACNRMYLPVCGSDGQTYANPCMLECTRKNVDSSIRLVRYGPCINMPVQFKADLKHLNCACNKMLLPVCGSDGQTYANQCLLECARDTQDQSLTVAHTGFCVKHHPVELKADLHHLNCACNRMLLPVCGSDGQTYANPCLLECARKTQDPSVKLEHYGECKNEAQTELKADPHHLNCACNRMYHPVCGSDGQTYANPCLLECARKTQDPSVKLDHFGVCEHEKQVFAENNCYCNNNYRPVCGTNGKQLKTFTNICHFSCAARDNSKWSFVKHTACEQANEVLVEQHHTFCTLEWAPICGSDGHTYGNKCFFEVAVEKNSGLTEAHLGACEEPSQNAVEQDLCACTDDYRPVCGSNGVTYANLCEFNCAARKNPALKVLYPMVCVVM